METQNAATCHGRNENKLTVQELLNDGSTLFLHPPIPPSDPTVAPPPPTSLLSKDDLNRLVAGVYSGPRIQDVENALSATSGHHYQQAQQEQTRLSFLERGLNKIENKYTLKMKCCSNGTADDGYKWRKYGQKSIKNSPHPRSYYKCTNPRCNAKKQVERSTKDPDMLMITYEGLHLHFIYPYFPYNQAQQQLNPPTKRPKKAAEVQTEAREAEQATNAANQESLQELGLEKEFGPQGLLEDVVPLIIRNPSCTTYVSSNNSSSSCSSYHSQSAPNSPSSLSWSPNYFPCFDIGINMSIM